MSQILTKVESLLKDKYLPAIANQINQEPSPFLEKIRKLPLTNNTIRFAMTHGINGGFGFGAEGLGTPKAGEQEYTSFSLDAVDMYVDIGVSNKTVELASSNAASMINVLDQEIKSCYTAAKWNLARALFGDGSGVLCRVYNQPTTPSLGGSGIHVHVDDASKLVEGLIVDIYSGTPGGLCAVHDVNKAHRILSVNYESNIVELDGGNPAIVIGTINADSDDEDDETPARTYNGFLTVQNSYNREICGLGSIFSTSSTSLYGVTKAGHSWIIPITHACGDDGIDDLVIYTGVKKARDRRGSNIDLVMMGDGAFRAYQAYMRANNVIVTERQRFVGGAVGYKVLAGNQEVTVVNEHFVPSGEAWGVDTSAFALCATPWNFMAKNGAIFLPMPGTSIYRALLASYGNLICQNPGGCVKFTGCVPTDNT